MIYYGGKKIVDIWFGTQRICKVTWGEHIVYNLDGESIDIYVTSRGQITFGSTFIPVSVETKPIFAFYSKITSGSGVDVDTKPVIQSIFTGESTAESDVVLTTMPPNPVVYTGDMEVTSNVSTDVADSVHTVAKSRLRFLPRIILDNNRIIAMIGKMLQVDGNTILRSSVSKNIRMKLESHNKLDSKAVVNDGISSSVHADSKIMFGCENHVDSGIGSSLTFDGKISSGSDTCAGTGVPQPIKTESHINSRSNSELSAVASTSTTVKASINSGSNSSLEYGLVRSPIAKDHIDFSDDVQIHTSISSITKMLGRHRLAQKVILSTQQLIVMIGKRIKSRDKVTVTPSYGSSVKIAVKQEMKDIVSTVASKCGSITAKSQSNFVGDVSVNDGKASTVNAESFVSVDSNISIDSAMSSIVDTQSRISVTPNVEIFKQTPNVDAYGKVELSSSVEVDGDKHESLCATSGEIKYGDNFQLSTESNEMPGFVVKQESIKSAVILDYDPPSPILSGRDNVQSSTAIDIMRLDDTPIQTVGQVRSKSTSTLSVWLSPIWVDDYLYIRQSHNVVSDGDTLYID